MPVTLVAFTFCLHVCAHTAVLPVPAACLCVPILRSLLYYTRLPLPTLVHCTAVRWFFGWFAVHCVTATLRLFVLGCVFLDYVTRLRTHTRTAHYRSCTYGYVLCRSYAVATLLRGLRCVHYTVGLRAAVACVYRCRLPRTFVTPFTHYTLPQVTFTRFAHHAAVATHFTCYRLPLRTAGCRLRTTRFCHLAVYTGLRLLPAPLRRTAFTLPHATHGCGLSWITHLRFCRSHARYGYTRLRTRWLFTVPDYVHLHRIHGYGYVYTRGYRTFWIAWLVGLPVRLPPVTLFSSGYVAAVGFTPHVPAVAVVVHCVWLVTLRCHAVVALPLRLQFTLHGLHRFTHGSAVYARYVLPHGYLCVAVGLRTVTVATTPQHYTLHRCCWILRSAVTHGYAVRYLHVTLVSSTVVTAHLRIHCTVLVLHQLVTWFTQFCYGCLQLVIYVRYATFAARSHTVHGLVYYAVTLRLRYWLFARLRCTYCGSPSLRLRTRLPVYTPRHTRAVTTFPGSACLWTIHCLRFAVRFAVTPRLRFTAHTRTAARAPQFLPRGCWFCRRIHTCLWFATLPWLRTTRLLRLRFPLRSLAVHCVLQFGYCGSLHARLPAVIPFGSRLPYTVRTRCLFTLRTYRIHTFYRYHAVRLWIRLPRLLVRYVHTHAAAFATRLLHLHTRTLCQFWPVVLHCRAPPAVIRFCRTILHTARYAHALLPGYRARCGWLRLVYCHIPVHAPVTCRAHVTRTILVTVYAVYAFHRITTFFAVTFCWLPLPVVTRSRLRCRYARYRLFVLVHRARYVYTLHTFAVHIVTGYGYVRLLYTWFAVGCCVYAVWLPRYYVCYVWFTLPGWLPTRVYAVTRLRFYVRGYVCYTTFTPVVPRLITFVRGYVLPHTTALPPRLVTCRIRYHTTAHVHAPHAAFGWFPLRLVLLRIPGLHCPTRRCRSACPGSFTVAVTRWLYAVTYVRLRSFIFPFGYVVTLFWLRLYDAPHTHVYRLVHIPHVCGWVAHAPRVLHLVTTRYYTVQFLITAAVGSVWITHHTFFPRRLLHLPTVGYHVTFWLRCLVGSSRLRLRTRLLPFVGSVYVTRLLIGLHTVTAYTFSLPAAVLYTVPTTRWVHTPHTCGFFRLYTFCCSVRGLLHTLHRFVHGYGCLHTVGFGYVAVNALRAAVAVTAHTTFAFTCPVGCAHYALYLVVRLYTCYRLRSAVVPHLPPHFTGSAIRVTLRYRIAARFVRLLRSHTFCQFPFRLLRFPRLHTFVHTFLRGYVRLHLRLPRCGCYPARLLVPGYITLTHLHTWFFPVTLPPAVGCCRRFTAVHVWILPPYIWLDFVAFCPYPRYHTHALHFALRSHGHIHARLPLHLHCVPTTGCSTGLVLPATTTFPARSGYRIAVCHVRVRGYVCVPFCRGCPILPATCGCLLLPPVPGCGYSCYLPVVHVPLAVPLLRLRLVTHGHITTTVHAWITVYRMPLLPHGWLTVTTYVGYHVTLRLPLPTHTVTTPRSFPGSRLHLFTAHVLPFTAYLVVYRSFTPHTYVLVTFAVTTVRTYVYRLPLHVISPLPLPATFCWFVCRIAVWLLPGLLLRVGYHGYLPLRLVTVRSAVCRTFTTRYRLRFTRYVRSFTFTCGYVCSVRYIYVYGWLPHTFTARLLCYVPVTYAGWLRLVHHCVLTARLVAHALRTFVYAVAVTRTAHGSAGLGSYRFTTYALLRVPWFYRFVLHCRSRYGLHTTFAGLRLRLPRLRVGLLRGYGCLWLRGYTHVHILLRYTYAVTAPRVYTFPLQLHITHTHFVCGLPAGSVTFRLLHTAVLTYLRLDSALPHLLRLPCVPRGWFGCSVYRGGLTAVATRTHTVAVATPHTGCYGPRFKFIHLYGSLYGSSTPPALVTVIRLYTCLVGTHGSFAYTRLPTLVVILVLHVVTYRFWLRLRFLVYRCRLRLHAARLHVLPAYHHAVTVYRIWFTFVVALRAVCGCVYLLLPARFTHTFTVGFVLVRRDPFCTLRGCCRYTFPLRFYYVRLRCAHARVATVDSLFTVRYHTPRCGYRGLPPLPDLTAVTVLQFRLRSAVGLPFTRLPVAVTLHLPHCAACLHGYRYLCLHVPFPLPCVTLPCVCVRCLSCTPCGYVPRFPVAACTTHGYRARTRRLPVAAPAAVAILRTFVWFVTTLRFCRGYRWILRFTVALRLQRVYTRSFGSFADTRFTHARLHLRFGYGLHVVPLRTFVTCPVVRLPRLLPPRSRLPFGYIYLTVPAGYVHVPFTIFRLHVTTRLRGSHHTHARFAIPAVTGPPRLRYVRFTTHYTYTPTSYSVRVYGSAGSHATPRGSVAGLPTHTGLVLTGLFGSDYATRRVAYTVPYLLVVPVLVVGSCLHTFAFAVRVALVPVCG